MATTKYGNQVNQSKYFEVKAVELFAESPNTQRLVEMLNGQKLKNEILGVAEKSFADGFLTAMQMFKQFSDMTDEVLK